MPQPDFKLDDFLPYKLSIAANTVSKRIARTYAPYKLSPTQWRVMAVLAGGAPMTAGAVADKTGMDKTTVSRAVAKMIDRRLVLRSASQIDGRAAPLSLNTQGKAMFGIIAPKVLAQEEKLKALFSDEQLNIFDVLLDRLKSLP